MRTLARFDPIAEFDNMNNLLDRLFYGVGRGSTTQTAQNLILPVDIFEKEDQLVVRAAVPGVKPEDLDVQVEDQVLTIKGETKQDEEFKDAKVYRREYAYGCFNRSVRLPDDLDLQKVDAKFENGFVTIAFPKLVQEKPKALKVNIRRAGEGETPA